MNKSKMALVVILVLFLGCARKLPEMVEVDRKKCITSCMRKMCSLIDSDTNNFCSERFNSFNEIKKFCDLKQKCYFSMDFKMETYKGYRVFFWESDIALLKSIYRFR